MNIKSKMTNEPLVENFLKVIGRDFSELGGEWPATASQIKGYFHDIFYRNLFEKYQKDPKKFQQALSLLPITVLRIFLLRDSILALKIAQKYHDFKISQGELVKFFLSNIEVISQKIHGDPFSLDKNLLLLKPEETGEIIQDGWLKFSSGLDKREINNFSVTLQSYLWSVQFDVYAYGIYWHGPYRLKEGTLLVKEFFDFNLPFWNKIDYSSAKVCYLFGQIEDLSVDAVCSLNYADNLWQNLVKVKVLIDRKNINSIKEIKKLDEYFSKARERQVKTVEQLTPLEIIKRGVEIYHYMFHEFFRFYNEDWRPSEEIGKRINELGLYYWDKFKDSGQVKGRDEIKNFLTKLYDPRNSFTG